MSDLGKDINPSSVWNTHTFIFLNHRSLPTITGQVVRASFRENTPSARAFLSTMFFSIPGCRLRGEPKLFQRVNYAWITLLLFGRMLLFFSHRCRDVTWREIVSFCRLVLNPASLLRLHSHLCVLKSSIKGNEPEENENPKTQNYLLRQIRSRKGNIWLARRRMVGGVGAVHGWSGGEQPALCFQTEWCTPWGHCRRPNITDTSAHILSLSHMHAHKHTHVCLHLHGHSHKNHNIPLLLWMFY